MKLKLSSLLTIFMVLIVQFSFGQEKTITGTVTGSDDGLPVAGANVIVKGTQRGKQTDFDGNYSLKASVGETLVFSFLGYKTVEIVVANSNTVDVVMEADTAVLDDVLIVAYSEVKKTSVTAAQTTIKAETIENVPIPSLDQVLQGQVAGLNVTANSGEPGSAASTIIRGRSSFNPGTELEPLYVVDGTPVDEEIFNSLNNNDIATLTVLKDAASSAIYGNRASNGVIIITTKKGTFNQDLSISYRTQFGISNQVNPQINFLDSRQLLEYQRAIGAGQGANLTDAEIDAFSQINTDWTNFLLRTGQTQSHEVTLSGGGENVRNFTSLSYFEQGGTTLRSNFQRLSLRSNTDLKGKRFDFSSNLSASFTRTATAPNANSGSLNNPFLAAFISLPFISPFDANGDLSLFGLPVGSDGQLRDPITGATQTPTGFLQSPFIAQNVAAFDTAETEGIRFLTTLVGTYRLTDKISLRSNFGLDYDQGNGLAITDPRGLRGINDTPNGTATLGRGSLGRNTFRDARINWVNSITYKNTFADKHNLEASGFVEYVKRNFRSDNFTGFGLDPRQARSVGGLLSGQTVEPDMTTPFVPVIGGTTLDTGLFSVFALGRYNYDNKYSVEASIRRDASSRFTADNEWGTFFAVSGRWNLTREAWLSDVSWLDNLALRVGYGEVGNQNTGFNNAAVFGAITSFQSETAIGGAPGTTRNVLGNSDLKWETKKSINIGVDYSFFNGKLSGALDVYQEDTEDILVGAPVSPAATGQTLLNSNLGELRNEGVELSVTYNIINNKNVNWSIFANGAYNRNEVLFIDGSDFQDRAGIFNDLQVGQRFGGLFSTRFAGVNPANGRPLFLDLDGNITESTDQANRVFNEDKPRDPKFNGGFGTNFSYKGFALTSLFSYAAEQYRSNGTLGVIEDPGLVGISNQSTRVLRRWQNPGDITDIPNPAFFSRGVAAGDRFIEDTSFLRLRNVTLAYTFNSEQLKDALKSVRIYAQGQNIFTLSKWKGFDPETSGVGSFFDFPVSRTFTLGLDVNF